MAGARTIEIGGSDALSVRPGSRLAAPSIGHQDDRLTVGKKLVIEAGDEVIIKCGDASITLRKDGTVAIRGNNFVVEATGDAFD